MTAEEQEKIKKSVKEGKRHQIHVYKRPDRAETLDMIQIVNGQLP